nr:Rop guanine nucleotide exchange factor 14 isoform X1 [Tanacetum cinerariifolium]
MKRDEHGLDEWEYSESPKHFTLKENSSYTIHYSDVEVMKEKFAKLYLGEDTTGGQNGVFVALALSNAITNLAGTVFGELWKLEPLAEEKKNKWRKVMDWLLSPTNYMIMTPKAHGDVHLNLLALQNLDSMLLETLDSMTKTEFWYEEGGSRDEGRSRNLKQSKRWWLPMPQVPIGGLSDGERKKLLNQAKLVHQIFKATKTINKSILIEMPITKIIGEALPKNLAFNKLIRIRDVSQEDILSDPDSPMATNSLLKENIHGILGLLSDEPSIRSATTIPSRSSRRCLGKEAYFSMPTDSP